MSMTEEFVTAFSSVNFDVESDKDLIAKGLEICEQFSIQPEEFVRKWEAYVDRIACEGPPKIDQFEAVKLEIARRIKKDHEKDPQQSGQRGKVVFDVASVQDLGNMLNQTNASTRKLPGKTKVKAEAPGHGILSNPLKRKEIEVSASLLPSSSKARILPQSPISDRVAPSGNESTDSSKYLNREHKLKTLSIMNEALSLSVGSETIRSRIEVDSLHTIQPYRYMYEKVENKCFVLRDRLRTLTDGIIEVHRLHERAKEEGYDFQLSPVNLASQEKVWCCGRICTEGDTGTLNPFSVALEGANGRRVKLDISALPEFAVFTGQIVVVEGNNSTGSCLVAHMIYCDATLPLPRTHATQIAKYNESADCLDGNPMNIIVACGPYTTSADFTFKPLDDLMLFLNEIRPDMLILCGPFADASHRLLDSSVPGMFGGVSAGDPPDSLELARRVVREHVIAGLKMIGGIKCAMIPSLLDLHSTCVFPQPPLDGEIFLPGEDDLYEHSESLPMLQSNPCTFRVNEIVVSVSTADILLHLSGNEASRLSSDRLSRLARHLIEQRSFYPLFPAPEGAQISIANAHKFDLQITPDILIVPSQLNPFAKRAGDVLCINPGRLTKGATAGTFARVTVHPIIRNICSKTTRTKANNVQDPTIFSDEKIAISPQAATAETSDCLPNCSRTDFEPMIGTEKNEDAGQPMAVACEEPAKTEILCNGADFGTTPTNVYSDNLAESGDLQSSSSHESEPILHRVLERTRVDIIRL